ncbi:hypothetical protein [Polyangium sp. y55x31]|uniref:hypothetical protein n=1 Tax=Polyangium sp. y55x31 TaxID=3042688 RepID=UPI00248231FC|nr:hypothetical protein [Polyangium sp. y55x31]MDI1480360.1 hypothetical protein [Polyangium sp. y55x31]
MEIRESLRRWVRSRRGRVASADGFTDAALLLEERLVTSLDIAEFVVFIESLRGEPLDMQALTPADLASIDAIVERLFSMRPPEVTHAR